MENIDKKDFKRKRNGNWGGIVLIVVGVFLLLGRMNLAIPAWAKSWQMLLIIIGVLVGAKHKFRGGGWVIMIIVGAIFMVRDFATLPFNSSQFVWPALLIALGIFMLFKKSCEYKGQGHKFKVQEGTSNEDTVNSIVVFSGESKIILSKNFKGGKITAVFGGSDINLMQADFNGTVEIDVQAVFGGTEIVVPSNWTVRGDISPIFGGVEDNRPLELMKANSSPEKILVLKGTCVFGGIEIKSYA